MDKRVSSVYPLIIDHQQSRTRASHVIPRGSHVLPTCFIRHSYTSKLQQVPTSTPHLSPPIIKKYDKFVDYLLTRYGAALLAAIIVGVRGMIREGQVGAD